MNSLKSLRLHIGIFGRVNSGKSSLVNAITGQDVSIVSEVEGTTTDVVEKSMELLPIGPVNFLDTAGLEDTSELGQQRIEKTLNVLNRTDIAVIVTDSKGFGDVELELIEKFNELNIPFCTIVNKSDVEKIDDEKLNEIKKYTQNILTTSALKDEELTENFIKLILNLIPDDFINSPKIFNGLLAPRDIVFLVIPIDKEAPKGRLILPQVQTIRELLDENCITVCVKVSELETTLKLVTPKLVVTDSQAFKEVSAIVPNNILITSFSILFARLKGDLNAFKNTLKLSNLLNPQTKFLSLKAVHITTSKMISRA